jgi:hypothetical protein
VLVFGDLGRIEGGGVNFFFGFWFFFILGGEGGSHLTNNFIALILC